VRQRLLAAVLVCGITVLAASVPGLASASGDLAESQRLVDLAQLDIQAVSLAHSLADERDDMAVFIAAGRTTASGAASKAQRTRVDRQVAEVTAQAVALNTGGSPALAAAVTEATTKLRGLPRIRQAALSGRDSAQTAVTAYGEVIDALNGIGGALARALPGRAASVDAGALPALSRAVDQASVQRALLVAALTASGSQNGPVSAAQASVVREQAALADFHAGASSAAADQYDETVTGSDVNAAERDLARLTDHSSLSYTDRAAFSASDVQAALSIRVDLMRGVESSLVASDAGRLASLRDDDVTALELRIALAAVCLLLATGVLIRAARSVTRPLAALNRFARGQAEQVAVAGADEFANIARSVNALAAEATQLRARVTDLGAGQARLTAERDALRERQKSLNAELGAVQGSVHHTFVNLTLRTLGLVERQLTHLERLEEVVHDPDELQQLFKLDHLATRMRRNSENLLVLAGTEHGSGGQARPVPLVDVARAAVSEIDRYERVRIQFLPAGRIVGYAADDTSHLLAELLENAAAFSPPQAEVQLSGWLLESGELMLSVEDQGIGMPAERLDELNRLLADPDLTAPGCETTGMGMYVIARLATRHGIRVQLRDHKSGGITAVVVLPPALVTPAALEDGPGNPVEAAAAGEPIRVRRPAPGPSGAATRPDVPLPRRGDPEPVGHERAAEEPAHPPARPEPAAPAADRDAPEAAEATQGLQLTAKGLPQRVPRATGLTGEPATRTPGAGPVDPEALRRKLGGFQQGLREGRREAEHETQEMAVLTGVPSARDDGAGAVGERGQGDGESRGESVEVEEARG
jgi:signal transduction histidine kinase